jgi:TonB family protein
MAKDLLVLALGLSLFAVAQESSLAAGSTAKAPPSKGADKAVSHSAPAANEKAALDAYMNGLNDRIAKVWSPPDINECKKVVVTITLEPTGELKSVEVKEPSGESKLDDAALSTVHKAAPFAKLPPAAKAGLRIDYTFEAGGAKAQDVDVNPYMDNLKNRLNRTWVSPKLPKPCNVTIAFMLDAQGKVVEAKVKRSCGNKTVDEQAVLAVKRAAPYGDLPHGSSDRFNIEYTFYCGPEKAGVETYKFNGTPIAQQQHRISSGGATLEALDTSSIAENRLREKNNAVIERANTLRDALANDEKGGDATRAKTAADAHELANCLRQLGDYPGAEALYKQSIEIREKLPDAKAGLARVLCDFAKMQISLGQLNDAEPLMKRACGIETDELKAVDATAQDTLETYAKLLYKLNREPDANEIYARIKQMKGGR